MKTIIVTGGAGFIGSNFVYHMLGKYPDYKIICIDCLTYAGNMSTLADAMKNPNFKFYKTDITDREAIYKIFEDEKPDVVVNFAAESHVDRSIENPEIFLKAIAHFNIDKKEALVFEDGHNGARAAINGGCPLIIVEDVARITDEDRQEALMCIDNIAKAIEYIEKENEGTSRI